MTNQNDNDMSKNGVTCVDLNLWNSRINQILYSDISLN